MSADEIAAELLLAKLDEQNMRLAILAREAARVARRCPLPRES